MLANMKHYHRHRRHQVHADHHHCDADSPQIVIMLDPRDQLPRQDARHDQAEHHRSQQQAGVGDADAQHALELRLAAPPKGLRYGRRLSVCLLPGLRLGSPGTSADAEDANRRDEHDGDPKRHAWPHRVHERLGEDGMSQPLQLLQDLRRDPAGQLQAAARLAAPDLEAMTRRLAEAIDERCPERGRQL